MQFFNDFSQDTTWAESLARQLQLTDEQLAELWTGDLEDLEETLFFQVAEQEALADRERLATQDELAEFLA